MLELISMFLRSLSTIAGDPSLGPKGAAIRAVLDLAAAAIERGVEGSGELKLLVQKIDSMVADGREPSPEEWDELKRRSDAAHDIIQNWKA